MGDGDEQNWAGRIRKNRSAVFKVLPLGVILPMSIFFGSVGPDDFAKNYAAWAVKFGLVDWANWLSQYATAPRVFWTVILFSVVYVAIVFGIPFLIDNTKTSTAVVAVPIGVALIVMIAVGGQYFIGLQQTAARSMTQAEFAKLVNTFSPIASEFPNLLVDAVASSDDAAGYAQLFMIAFHRAGITVEGVKPNDENGILYPSLASVQSPQMKGLFIGVQNSNSPPAVAIRFHGALAEVGYQARFLTWGSMKGNDFVFVVSYR